MKKSVLQWKYWEFSLWPPPPAHTLPPYAELSTCENIWEQDLHAWRKAHMFAPKTWAAIGSFSPIMKYAQGMGAEGRDVVVDYCCFCRKNYSYLSSVSLKGYILWTFPPHLPAVAGEVGARVLRDQKSSQLTDLLWRRENVLWEALQGGHTSPGRELR